MNGPRPRFALLFAIILAASALATSAQAAVTLVSPNVANGWASGKQRLVIHNGQNFFLIYNDGSNSILYKASSDNVTWSSPVPLVSDYLSVFDTFDIYLVDDSTFDLIYPRSTDNFVRVRTCTISNQSITADAGSTPIAESWFGVSVARTPGSNRLFAVGRIGGGSLRVYSADQTGAAAGVTSWTGEVTTQDTNVVGRTAVTPYGGSDKVLVIYQKNPGGTNSDGIYSRAVMRGGGAGTSIEIGNLNSVGVLSSPTRISDAAFHYILSDNGSAPAEYVWNDVSWTGPTTLANANTASPSLLYERTAGDLYMFAIDTGTNRVMRYRKPAAGTWDGGTIADGGEPGTHSLSITQMTESPAGSGRAACEVVWGYRVGAGPYDLYVGNLGLGACAASPSDITGRIFEDVNYGGGAGRDYATAVGDAPTFTVERDLVTVELYDAAGNFQSSTTTAADGTYSFTGLTPALYTLRVVNSTVTSTRVGSNGTELAVQTYRVDGNGEPAGTGASRVGGERPSNEDAAANSGAQTLAALQGTDLDADGVTEWTQSIVTVDASGGDVSGVDFGFNFDTIVNTNDTGQGSLRQFILNSNLLSHFDPGRPGKSPLDSDVVAALCRLIDPEAGR